MGQAVVVLKKGEGRTLKAGGMWVYDNEIASVTGSYEDGDMVIVRDFDGFSMGRGFINRHSKIRGHPQASRATIKVFSSLFKAPT